MMFLFKSDLHLDFHVPFNKNQAKMEKNVRDYARNMYENSASGAYLPVLIGGDFANINHYAKWFLDELSIHAKHIFVVWGNHDYYLDSKSQEGKYKNDSRGRTDEVETLFNTNPKITFLKNFEVVEYEGFKIAGATNWYKLDTFNEKLQFKMMNDSRCIKGYDVGHEGYLEDLAWDENMVESVDIMLTHVSPIFTNSNHLKGAECYVSPRDITKAKYWFCGHVHEVLEYEKAGTKIFTNANGYSQELETKETAHKFGRYDLTPNCTK